MVKPKSLNLATKPVESPAKPAKKPRCLPQSRRGFVMSVAQLHAARDAAYPRRWPWSSVDSGFG